MLPRVHGSNLSTCNLLLKLDVLESLIEEVLCNTTNITSSHSLWELLLYCITSDLMTAMCLRLGFL